MQGSAYRSVSLDSLLLASARKKRKSGSLPASLPSTPSLLVGSPFLRPHAKSFSRLYGYPTNHTDLIPRLDGVDDFDGLPAASAKSY